MLDALSFTPECSDKAVVCDTDNGTCALPGGRKLELLVIRNMDDIFRIDRVSGDTVLYFTNQGIAYKAKRKTGSMVLELLDERLDGASGVIVAGLHVIASWEFDILARNEWGYIYLPVDASLTGDFVPLYELAGKNVKVALGSGVNDARFRVCDYRGVVWTALINQYNILRDNRSILGVWRAAIGGWRVYGLEEPDYVRKLYNIGDPDIALRMVYLYARKRLDPVELADVLMGEK